jgi:amidase
VSFTSPQSDIKSYWCREYKKYSKPTESEITVAKVDAYNDMNAYLSELSNTSIKSVEDIVEYNDNNTGTEGAEPGDHPAFMTGQVSSYIQYILNA